MLKGTCQYVKILQINICDADMLTSLTMCEMS